ncbi:HypC/HybG/HupF family hydrogenase formation chaperone [Clostridium aminobutyricum]|uniref:HypC/HybG/HupF family hydrogenase formation chaperone n=1 Tax=Clostridium aminobutyricum TaxID=33953 RepID=A0A939IHM2_CLOAM|nr:HypC/HybG/HupF family hydrogenase formation chaperone [Clostridium aminobutyricum]MBN7773967.1 HypC/HybG/HupF family hydrogenase formation chaperone [Clostridium aminobutyricum]
MCLAIPAMITSVRDNYADAETMGIKKKINIQLIDSPLPGDYVLIHAGFAIEKIDAAYYGFLNKTFQEMIEGNDNG